MPKKPPPNGYYFFMKHYKEREERMGRRFANGMKDVAELASDEWKNLSQSDRDYYNKLAKEHRNDPRPNIPKQSEKKFNSVGISFAQLEREKVEKETKVLQRKDYVHSLVNELDIEELKGHSFYLIHVNYFCKTDHDEYFPAELAISEFSLINGVQKVFHRFLHPGQVPTGYASEVKDHSDKYHKIPWDFVRGENKYDTVYTEICEFLKGKYGRSELPPLFTMYDNLFDNTSLSAVKKTLATLWDSANYVQADGDWEKDFRVYPLPHFFHELKRKCLEATNSKQLSFPNDIMAEAELRRDTYHFSSEMACKFHQDEDVIAFCSQSYVIRWVHIIRDHCCDCLGISIFRPTSYASDTQVPPTKVEVWSEEEDEEEEEEKYDDCKSTKSGYSTATFLTDKSVDFRSVSGKSSVKSVALTNQSSSAGHSFASAVSNSAPPPGNSWASASQPKQAPTFDNKNFPSLGMGRGRRLELAKGMANLNLKK